MGLFSSEISTKEKIVLYQSLSFMISSGINIREGLTLLSTTKGSKLNKKATAGLLYSLDEGETISQAFQSNEKLLGKGVWQQLKAADRSGKVAECFERLSSQSKGVDSISGKIRGAMAYPTLMLLGIVGIFFYLFTTVIPQIGEALSDLNTELPAITLAMMNASDYVLSHKLLSVAFIVIPIIVLILLIKFPLKYRVSKMLCKLPFVGDIVINSTYANFYQILSDMIVNGSSSVEALTIATGSVKNLYIFEELKKCCTQLQVEAITLAEAISLASTVPWDDRVMIEIAQRSNRLIEIMEDLTASRFAKANESINTLMEMMTPLMTVLIGLMVGLLVMVVYMPIMQVTTSMA